MVGVRRELGGCCVVENQCVGRHVDTVSLYCGGNLVLVAVLILEVGGSKE